MRTTLFMIAASATTLLAATSHAQKITQTGPGAGGSPHVKAEYTIDGATLSLHYGRPALKGRPEAQLMPPGKPWRTGADTATIITTNKALTFGSVTLQPGSYTINTQPGPQWSLILGRLSSPGQWGVPYNATLEIGRAPMTGGKTAAPVDLLTVSIDDTPAGATLRVEWGTTSATIPFTIAR